MASRPRCSSSSPSSTPARPGLKLTHVNYKGTGPLVAALLGNQVDLAFIDIAAAVPSLKAGTLRALP